MECIRIGFIGAGKVGVSLGKYLKEKGREVGGYYSLSPESARWAAEFTGTTHYKNLEEIISSCDMILFTVPDHAIATVWEEAKPYISGKIVGHCSGLYSSNIFSDTGSMNCYACSIHPLLAVSDRETSWKEFSDALFVLEGDETYLHTIEELFRSMGNRTRSILAENKIKYHAAAAISSNYMTALFFMSEHLLSECGFAEEEAREELFKLAEGNLRHIRAQGCAGALTGPLERGDVDTVKKHINALTEDVKQVYMANASYLIQVAEKKHPDRDYSVMRSICGREKEKAQKITQK